MVLVGLVVGYSVVFSLLSIAQRATFVQFDEDLAIYDQIVWNTAHGRLFQSTLIQHADNMLGDHFSPAIALFVPAYWIWPDACVLLIGQSVALALAALPLAAFARRLLGAPAAVLVVGAYLLYPALHYVNLFQFHEIALLPLPLALAMLAIERGWRRVFFGSALIALMVKEEVAIVVVTLGLLWWLRGHNWRLGLITIALGVAVGALTMGVILPHFNAADDGYYYTRRYAYLGSTVEEIARTALTRPDLVVEHLITPDRGRFLLELVGPLLFLPLLGWEYGMAALPVLGYLLLAESPDQHAINRHYLTPLLPYLFVATVLGLDRLRSILAAGRGPTWSRRSAVLLAGMLGIVVAASAYAIGPTPPARNFNARAFTMTAHADLVKELIERIPPDAAVSGSRNVLSWLSQRERVYRFPELRDAEYVLLEWSDLRFPTVFEMDDGAFERLLVSPDYRLVASAGAAVLFQRGDPVTRPAPDQVPTRFGDELELLDARADVLPRGPTLVVTLDWRAVQRPALPYTVFIHVLDDQRRRIGQHDAWPLDNLFPTDRWLPGRIVPDTETITLPRLRPGDRLWLQVGLYDGRTGKRLPVTARGLPGGVDFVEIGPVIVSAASILPTGH